MLILNRRIGSRVYVKIPGQNPITISVLSIKGNEVEIGIDASRDIKIIREEIMHLPEKKKILEAI